VKRHASFVTENMLQVIADEFETQWNFPNCVGAFDGKLPPIRRPQNSGSHSYNYKSHFYVHLQAIVDAKYTVMTWISEHTGDKVTVAFSPNPAFTVI